jgi:hypothetical protein
MVSFVFTKLSMIYGEQYPASLDGDSRLLPPRSGLFEKKKSESMQQQFRKATVGKRR